MPSKEIFAWVWDGLATVALKSRAYASHPNWGQFSNSFFKWQQLRVAAGPA